jgi:superoxide dismutase, Fe-Mn family
MLLSPREFPNLPQCDAISESAMGSHLRLYDGYVQKFNQLRLEFDSHQQRGPGIASADAESLKTDLTFALGAIKNHDLFFEHLGPEGDGPTGVLADALVKSFHSLPQYLIDLKQTALLGRGWAWTAYDLDLDFLFNYHAGAQNGLPVWNATPLLAIDLYGHAYFYDYGNNRVAYIEAIMKNLDWKKIGERFATITPQLTRSAAAS